MAERDDRPTGGGERGRELLDTVLREVGVVQLGTGLAKEIGDYLAASPSTGGSERGCYEIDIKHGALWQVLDMPGLVRIDYKPRFRPEVATLTFEMAPGCDEPAGLDFVVSEVQRMTDGRVVAAREVVAAPSSSSGGPEAHCSKCRAPKGLRAVGESCNQNCGGRVVALKGGLVADPRPDLDHLDGLLGWIGEYAERLQPGAKDAGVEEDVVRDALDELLRLRASSSGKSGGGQYGKCSCAWVANSLTTRNRECPYHGSRGVELRRRADEHEAAGRQALAGLARVDADAADAEWDKSHAAAPPSASDGGECAHCPDGHRRPGSKPMAVEIGSVRDADGQPIELTVRYCNGHHVSEREAQWLRGLIAPASDGEGLRDEKLRQAHERIGGDGTIDRLVAEFVEGDGPEAIVVAALRRSAAAHGAARVAFEKLADGTAGTPPHLSAGDARRAEELARDALARYARVRELPAGEAGREQQLVEFDAWLSMRGEFREVLTAFRRAFGTDTSATAAPPVSSEGERGGLREWTLQRAVGGVLRPVTEAKGPWLGAQEKVRVREIPSEGGQDGD